MQTDWYGLVGVPFLIAVISLVFIFLRNPHARDLHDTRRFLWSTLAAAIVWAIIRAWAQYRERGGLGWEPLIGGLALGISTLIVRWLLLATAGQFRRR